MPTQKFAFFLGGYDLEMVTIRDLIQRDAPGQMHDKHLPWGAKASAYRQEIHQAIDCRQQPVLVELENDLGLPAVPYAPAAADSASIRQSAFRIPHPNGSGLRIPHSSDSACRTPHSALLVVDHHGPLAGTALPTSLEQVFALLSLPSELWTRHLALVAANDRAHIRGLQAAGATQEEIIDIRAADRAAQGVTQSDEQAADRAVASRQELAGGKLTVLCLDTNRTSPAADRMEPALGGPGYQNLLIECPNELDFFGEGRLVLALANAFKGTGWHGGDLPERGFWGCPRPPTSIQAVQTLLLDLLAG